jgi:hypothetical protein
MGKDYCLGSQRLIAYQVAVQLAEDWVSESITSLRPGTDLPTFLGLSEGFRIN